MIKSRLLLIIITLILAFFLWGSFLAKSASSQLGESRLSGIEADLNIIESRLRQLEAQVNRTNVSPLPRTNPSPTLTPRTQSGNRRNDPQFDRLATLVVELKQQVNSLEKRVTKLEKS